MDHPYNITQNDENVYSFTTDIETEYSIVFIEDYTLSELTKKDYPSVYNIVITRNEVKTFEDLSSQKRIIRKDPRVSSTINDILKQFLQIKDNCLSYLCDVTDKKQYGRKLLFDKWYNNNPDKEKVTKWDFEFKEEDLYGSYLIPDNYIKKKSILKDLEKMKSKLDDKEKPF